jgi:tetratricopeptide (TPR) repeat protein
MTEALPPVEVFCSYAHEDETWLRKLETHLSLLKRQGLISLWHDRLIVPGTDWARALDTHLETASVVLLLVSADFFASDYCYGIEMKRALEREATGEARVVPILTRPVDWAGAPFAYLQALPTDAKPIASWRDTDQALADVAAGIRRMIEDVPLLAASVPRSTLPAIWNIPYPRNPFFLGRNNELAQLRSHLRAGQATALSQPQAIGGLGGIGKTQLALEYAYRYHQDYQVVLWERAESTEALVSSYIAIASLLQLPEREAKEQDITVQAVKVWLQTHRDWLLILDNADELTLLPDFLPSTLGGHLLLTTRAATAGRMVHRLEIETLLPEHGALFLLRRARLIAPDETLEQTSLEEQNLALKISQELGRLPLALDQAGAYLEETGMGLSSYWHIYQSHRADLLRRRGGLVADHPDSVATTWSLSFQKVEEKNPAAADLLRLCAYLAPEAIPEEILTVGTSSLGSVLALVAEDAFLLNQALEALRAYSLITRDPGKQTLTIHRLVQAVLHDSMTIGVQQQWMQRAIQAVEAAHPCLDVTSRALYERLLPHAFQCATWIRCLPNASPISVRLLNQAGRYLEECGRYQEAKQLLEQALTIGEEQIGANHSTTATSLSNLANLYFGEGKFEEAKVLYQRALLVCEQIGTDQLAVATCLDSLANIYTTLGEYAEAEALYQRAFSIREQESGAKPADRATSFATLAHLRIVQGKYAEAEPLLQQALSIDRQVHGTDHPETGASLANLGYLYFKQEKYAEAEPLLQQALSIDRQVHGTDYATTANTLMALATLYSAQKKYAEAEPLLQQALSIDRQVHGTDHATTANILMALADIRYGQEEYTEAEPLYQRVLLIREQAFGTSHPFTATCCVRLGYLYFIQERYAEAEALLQQALAIFESQLDICHPETVRCLNYLAELYLAQKRYSDVETLYQRSLVISEQQLGWEHLQTQQILKNYLLFLAEIRTGGDLEALLQLLGQKESDDATDEGTTKNTFS